MPKKLLIALFLVGFFLFHTTDVSAATYYVATNGSDTNNGSQSAPFKTFSRAMTALVAGDTLLINAGTYTSALRITKSGTTTSPITIKAAPGQKVIINLNNSASNGVEVRSGISNIVVSDLEVVNSNGYCVSFSGQNIISRNFIVHECEDHGTYVDGKNITIDAHTIYRTNLSNQARTAESGWGSALKLRIGAENTIVENNTIYENYGEGIAATRAKNTIIRNNLLYDNFSVQIYVDNSINTTVENNFMYCTPNSGFEYNDSSRRGRRPNSIAVGEEQYDGWGAQLSTITVKNNIAGFCLHGFDKWNSDVGGGLKGTNLIAYNTFWGSTDSAFAYHRDTADGSVTVQNNIIQQPQNDLSSVSSRTGMTFSNNFWVGVSTAPTNAGGTGDKFGNVALATTPAYDFTTYSLSASSTARNGAVTINSIPIDFDGKNRYTATSPQGDIGALEFDGTGPVVSPRPTPPATPRPSSSPGCVPSADANNDGQITASDGLVMLRNFLKHLSGQQNGDFNCDGKINMLDFGFFFGNFLNP